MPKGSQLSQLKSALSHAGITGQQTNGKKRKRTSPHTQDKDKKAAKLTEIHQKLNPFDVKVTKLKHDVGGRKIKGITGRPAQSKQAGIEQRKKTLLKEYEEKGRSGGVLDRRFGENDPTMSLEERMLERFTKERQRTSRGAAFNLEDDEDLTHYGQSLSKLDDFDNVGLGLEDDEDDDRGQIDRDVVKKTHFGGFSDDEPEEDEEEPARKKSKAEVMAEVMAKSKEYKLRRQMEREQEDNIRHELDQNFDSLRSLLYAPDPSSTGSNSVPLGRIREDIPKTNTTIAPPVTDDVDYDTHVRELAFDKRAQPKDRTKTEEELALEEKEALEKAERRRRRRMLGEDQSDSEADDGKAKGKGKGKRKRERGADDLDDDFQEEEDGLGVGLGADIKVTSDEESEGSIDNEEDESESEEETEGDESELSDDSNEDSEAEEGEQNDLTTSGNSLNQSTKKINELPFTFSCPGTHVEFLKIVEDLQDDDIPIVVKRIRALYHPSLAPENKFKLQTLTAVLIDHVLYITSPPSPRLNLLSSFLPHLFALSKAYPIQAAECFVEKLALMHKNLKRGLSHGPLHMEAKTWPNLPEISLLRIIGTVWPTSDMNHAVISPSRLLMGAYLGLGRVRSMADIASGLFLCTLFLQFEQLSKRLVPEAINFLINTVLHICPHQIKDTASLPGSFPSPDLGSDLCRPLSIKPKKASGLTVQKPDLYAVLSGNVQGEQSKIDLLGTAFDLLGRFADLYKGLDGFVELYQPINEILLKLDLSKLPKDLQTRVVTFKDATGRLLKFSSQTRHPLALQAHKPIPIPTYIPKFESTSSSYLRRQDPDHERNEASKLRHQYKQEKKGAIRELRKDARFLAAVEQKKQSDKDKAYKDSMNKVFGSIEGERAEQKVMEREKAREKKRSGRK